jgi:hypothetical protein
VSSSARLARAVGASAGATGVRVTFAAARSAGAVVVVVGRLVVARVSLSASDGRVPPEPSSLEHAATTTSAMARVQPDAGSGPRIEGEANAGCLKLPRAPATSPPTMIV